MSGIPTIGDVVREWRRYRQISLTEFSKQTKLTKGYISELEHNKIDNPKPDKLERMAAALRISVLDIVSRRMPDEVKDGNVGGEEDMEGITLVEDAEEATSEVQPAVGQVTQKAVAPSDVLAATGTFGAPSSLMDDREQQLPTLESFEEQVRQIITSYHLPYAKRMIAQQMSLEAIRIICWGLKEAEE